MFTFSNKVADIETDQSLPPGNWRPRGCNNFRIQQVCKLLEPILKGVGRIRLGYTLIVTKDQLMLTFDEGWQRHACLPHSNSLLNRVEKRQKSAPQSSAPVNPRPVHILSKNNPNKVVFLPYPRGACLSGRRQSRNPSLEWIKAATRDLGDVVGRLARWWRGLPCKLC